jgi:hypothetical protein
MVCLVNPPIRVNRVGGPMGHAGGMIMPDLHQETVSPYVSNALPCNFSFGNIVVRLQLQDLTVPFAVPYYIGVRQQEELAVAVLPHSSIPWHGFLPWGAKVFKDFQL